MMGIEFPLWDVPMFSLRGLGEHSKLCGLYVVFCMRVYCNVVYEHA